MVKLLAKHLLTAVDLSLWEWNILGTAVIVITKFES